MKLFKGIIGLTLAASLMYVACSDPYTYTGPVHVNPGNQTDTTSAPDTVTPGPVIPPTPPIEVTVMESFTENFSAKTSELFAFQKSTVRPDFRYYPAFPSLSESGTTILMLRLDPKDAAGEGALVGATGYIDKGSLSVRMRTPDVASVQSNVGSSAELQLLDPDGKESFVLSFKRSEPGKVYVGESAMTPEISGFKACSKFYIYGLDWTEEKLSVWIKTGAKADKQVLTEITENLPSTPLRPVLRFYTPSGKLPLYPYELEVNWISYTAQ
jgi:hypothetical protein